jgi:hypothetical protein
MNPDVRGIIRVPVSLESRECFGISGWSIRVDLVELFLIIMLHDIPNAPVSSFIFDVIYLWTGDGRNVAGPTNLRLVKMRLYGLPSGRAKAGSV